MKAVQAASEGIHVGANPFSRRAVLSIVLLGAALLVALLWMIGTGTGVGSTNDGQAHAGGKGLNGYAALAEYLDQRGFPVNRARSDARLTAPGLLILTPPARADGEEIERIVNARRQVGPTLIITPKWIAAPPSREQTEARKGWVQLAGTEGPVWRGFLDDVSVAVGPVAEEGQTARWSGLGLSGNLADPRHVLWGTGDRLVPLVTGPQGRILAALIDDEGPEATPGQPGRGGPHPLVIVFEPDLLNNYGMALVENARLAEALVRSAGAAPSQPLMFDMTLNGFGRSNNLLTLAFTPPFLAATLCLLLAATVVGWRAFLRFGPPVSGERAMAFGKRTLVANSAGFVRRSGRLHLIAGPYADRARERLARALGLSRHMTSAQAEDAIDRALASRHSGAEPFSVTAARLRSARRPHDLLKAARDLHALERKLMR